MKLFINIKNDNRIIRSGNVKSNNVFGEWMFDALTNKNMAYYFLSTKLRFCQGKD